MLTTKNYKFKKPELTDSPPDITVTNPNWDDIDDKLFKVIQAWEEFKANGGEIGGPITTNEIHYKSESNISYKVQMLDNGFYVLSRFINGVFSENVMRFDTNNTNINGHIIPFSDNNRSNGLPNARWSDVYTGTVKKSVADGTDTITNGVVIKWGDYTTSGIGAGASLNPQIVFPLAFPNNCWMVIPYVKRILSDQGATIHSKVRFTNVTVNSRSAFQTKVLAEDYVSGGVIIGYIAIGS